ncbi:hypothetical protein [Bradyrhizobium sp. 2TAF24]|uniref:hypothetical protein n=1 Tax=Bradyrhizobium sp. 2TAF24 TaxID=3233011 RepID=UPI003F91FF42
MPQDYLTPRIESDLTAEFVSVGKGVVVEPGVTFKGKDGPMRSIVLGDFCFLGGGTKVVVPEFRLGDYSKLHGPSLLIGDLPLRIGRNCWIGQGSVLDSNGGLDIDDNVCVGVQSQLLTHARFGDIVEGSRFHCTRYMYVPPDVWFAGQCTVQPVNIERRAMALAGSVVTHDMVENHVYAGVPAIDITDRIGPQFADVTVEQKRDKLTEILDAFLVSRPEHAGLIRVITDEGDEKPGVTNVNVATRTYTQTFGRAEVDFFRVHVPIIKFTPKGAPPFVVRGGA